MGLEREGTFQTNKLQRCQGALLHFTSQLWIDLARLAKRRRRRTAEPGGASLLLAGFNVIAAFFTLAENAFGASEAATGTVARLHAATQR